MKKVIRKIFLDNLPHKQGFGKNKIVIDWEKSIGETIRFIYGEIEGEFKIINYKNKRIYFEYDNNIYDMLISNFIYCKFNNILKDKIKALELEKIIGKQFKDDKRDLIIIESSIKHNKSNNKEEKWCKYHCNRCGYEGWILLTSLNVNKGCRCCHGTVVNKGINDIATTHPHLIKYFVNIEDTYTHSFGSQKKIQCKCPFCDYRKETRITTLVIQGFSCPKCGDGISYPEKFMLNLLEQLKQNKQLDDFIYQYSKTNADWCGSSRYDFYFEKDGQSYIVETHGEQHYKENGFTKSLKDIQNNDIIKQKKAINNMNNYIIIDCSKSNLIFIKNNIINSPLSEIFDFTNINWEECNQKALNNKIKEICDYWYIHNNINKEKITINNMSKIFKTSVSTIYKYLKIGDKLNWCNYN